MVDVQLGSKNASAFSETCSKVTNLLQSFDDSGGNTYISVLLLIITLRFTRVGQRFVKRLIKVNGAQRVN